MWCKDKIKAKLPPWVLWVLWVLQLHVSAVAIGMVVLERDALGAEESKPAISNIGFMENPPKDLKIRFPMCNAFLKVEWFDRGKRAGYSEFDFYNKGEKISRTAKALVYLGDDHPEFDINLEFFSKKGKLKEIFETIRREMFDRQGQGDGLVIHEERKGKFSEYEFRSIRADWDMPLLTLADHKMNVCIPYPDNQRMYFAEQKVLNKIYNKNEIDSKRAELKKWVAKPSFMESYIAMDANLDGIEDYLTETAIIYSHNGKYIEMKIIAPKFNSDSPNSSLNSPTNSKTCEFLHQWNGSYFFTTDGTNVFIDNQCNLTELTK